MLRRASISNVFKFKFPKFISAYVGLEEAVILLSISNTDLKKRQVKCLGLQNGFITRLIEFECFLMKCATCKFTYILHFFCLIIVMLHYFSTTCFF